MGGDTKRFTMLRTLSQGSGTGLNRSNGQLQFIALALPQSDGLVPAIIHLDFEHAGVIVRGKLPPGTFNECASGFRELLR
jgi:hypothetical protein